MYSVHVQLCNIKNAHKSNCTLQSTMESKIHSFSKMISKTVIITSLTMYDNVTFHFNNDYLLYSIRMGPNKVQTSVNEVMSQSTEESRLQLYTRLPHPHPLRIRNQHLCESNSNT